MPLLRPHTLPIHYPDPPPQFIHPFGQESQWKKGQGSELLLTQQRSKIRNGALLESVGLDLGLGKWICWHFSVFCHGWKFWWVVTNSCLNLSSLRHTNHQKDPDKDTGPIRKNDKFCTFHHVQWYCRFCHECCIFLDKLCYSNRDVKKTPPHGNTHFGDFNDTCQNFNFKF